MKNLFKKITKTQFTTIVLLVAYGFWELSVYKWAQTLPASDPIIRVDLLFIYPVLLVLILISLFQVVKKRTCHTLKK